MNWFMSQICKQTRYVYIVYSILDMVGKLYLNVALDGASDKELLVRIKRNALDGAVVCL